MAFFFLCALWVEGVCCPTHHPIPPRINHLVLRKARTSDHTNEDRFAERLETSHHTSYEIRPLCYRKNVAPRGCPRIGRFANRPYIVRSYITRRSYHSFSVCSVTACRGVLHTPLPHPRGFLSFCSITHLTDLVSPITHGMNMTDFLYHAISASLQRGYIAAFRILGNAEESRDACQEAATRALSARHKYDPAQPFYPWFYRILKNHCLDRLRQRKKTLPPKQNSPNWCHRNPRQNRALRRMNSKRRSIAPSRNSLKRCVRSLNYGTFKISVTKRSPISSIVPWER